MSGGTVNLRERQRLLTRRTVQQHALRLFGEQGFDETTVNEVARAAGVSPMTVYRHFPTKEDLVLGDEYDPLIAQRIAERPAGEPLMRRIGATLVEQISELQNDGGNEGESPAELLLARLRLVLATPALRARRWDSQYATQQAIVEALRADPPDPELEFRVRVAAGACLSAASAAVLRWAEEDGRPDLSRLLTQALAIVSEGQC
ncbi:TetR/AcrR family transcriptional regulator [Amycolatopsis jiangsuensis]|uniref:AcrR family transcriptional regulator n=1 Tax=Amycolatopsis jiangsuensis TaxID=1181879 RepID=A0A840J2E0_9PSEU|nr:TetR/AcrR family transcriptional regulator [Amycolatopsis jiangsuensis]MBB4687647.1 AcrR family transcriptional regulator [Amycolatopsis jiangsuensis]